MRINIALFDFNQPALFLSNFQSDPSVWSIQNLNVFVCVEIKFIKDGEEVLLIVETGNGPKLI